MKHFLITRFNLRQDKWKTSKNGTAVLTDKWLKNRFVIFENYCLPSVINQSTQDFCWLVFFDTETPENYRSKIAELSLKYKNFRPVYVEGMVNFKKVGKENILKEIKVTDKFMITTRLDNDDVIHKDFIKTIQMLYKPVHNTVIDLRKGYQVTLKTNHSQIRKITNDFNPYISLIETVEHFNTVLSKNHKDWRNAASVIIYNKEPLWCELVHQENLSNSTRKYSLRSYSMNNMDFGLSGEFKESFFSVFFSNLSLQIKIFLYNIKKKINFSI